MLKIAVCYSDENTCNRVGEIVNAVAPGGLIKGYGNSFDILADLDNGETFDIFILFMNTENEDRRVAKYIRGESLCRESIIIFVSDTNADVSEIVEVSPFAFIWKNELEKHLPDKLRQAIGTISDKSIFEVKSGGDLFRLKTSDIMYIKADIKDVTIYTVDGVITTSRYQYNQYAHLLDKRWMIKCNNTYWVNIYHIKRVSVEGVCMKNGQEIAISRTYRNQVLQAVGFDKKNAKPDLCNKMTKMQEFTKNM